MKLKLTNHLKNLEQDISVLTLGGELREEEELRAKLAVRGWTKPNALISILNKERRADLLESIAANVQTASYTHPGQWFLDNDMRVRTLAEIPKEALKQLVKPEVGVDNDADDPVRQAFDVWLNRPTYPLSELNTTVLQALQQIQDWTDGVTDPIISPIKVETELAARQLKDDLTRLTKFDIIGQGHQQAVETLYEFVTAALPISANPLQERHLGITYLYGVGGSGKSTVLASLQQRFENEFIIPLDERLPDQLVMGAIARIDFDEPNIDPTRLATLNLTLIEQLCRTVPSLSVESEFLINELRGQVYMQLDQDLASSDIYAGRDTKIFRESRFVSESINFTESSHSGSLLYDKLSQNHLNGPLVLILDTAELVLAQGDSKAIGIFKWLEFLQFEAGAEDIRLVIAGRDPMGSDNPSETGPAMRNLLDRLNDLNAVREPDIHLGQLKPNESEELLEKAGLEDVNVRHSAARAVPGIPLLLRITAASLQADNQDLKEDVLRAHALGQVDRETARTYLMQRIVAHVTDPIARPYILGAMISPILTPDLLQYAIIPAVSRDLARRDAITEAPKHIADLSERVFDALKSTHWLCRPSADPDILFFERSIREFILDLIEKVHHDGVLARDIRSSAAIYHRRKQGAMHRAMTLYHLAMMNMEYSLPQNREAVQKWLQDVYSELPTHLQTWLEPTEKTEAYSHEGEGEKQNQFETVSSQRYSDEEWRLYLEGTSKDEGEGMRMVKRDQAREALNMYRDRPTRQLGRPPTFVIRALTDLGEFDTPDLDLDEKLGEGFDNWVGSKRLSPNDLSKIYWLTRYALLCNKGELSRHHTSILEAASRKAKGPGLTQIPSLIAVAEAVQQSEIMDNRMRRAALKSGNEVRILLGASQETFRKPKQFGLKQIAVVQHNWAEEAVEAMRSSELDQSKKFYGAQDWINNLDNQPLAEVNQRLEQFSGKVAITPTSLDVEARVLLFRGFTHEFHKPLREVLLNDSIVPSLYENVFEDVLSAMTIIPEEFDIESLRLRLERNPDGWVSGFIAFADQARLLPLIFERLERSTKNKRALQLCASFKAWDTALCRGGSSLWRRKKERT